MQVVFDEKQTLELCDETFQQGRIGLWTKSDAVTYFDDYGFIFCTESAV